MSDISDIPYMSDISDISDISYMSDISDISDIPDISDFSDMTQCKIELNLGCSNFYYQFSLLNVILSFVFENKC